MGVSGSGKTTVATALGEALGLIVIEGDDHHPKTNVEKMAVGIPLTDDDRRPWLEALADLTRAHHDRGEGTVLACSALRRRYRDTLRAPLPRDASFAVLLHADPETLQRRMRTRPGHFMPPSLLESQLATLEPLETDEAGVTVDASRDAAAVIAEVIAAITGAVPTHVSTVTSPASANRRSTIR
jgi:gluconokinase